MAAEASKPRLKEPSAKFHFIVVSMTGILSDETEQQRRSARRSLSQYISDAKIERPVSEGPGAALALISLIVIVACVGAAIALTQIRSLKSEITALHRELAPLKERVAQLDQAEKARRQAEQEGDATDKSAVEKQSDGGNASRIEFLIRGNSTRSRCHHHSWRKYQNCLVRDLQSETERSTSSGKVIERQTPRCRPTSRDHTINKNQTYG